MYKELIRSVDDYDIKVNYYGEEMCQPGYEFGPAVRDVFLVHYIIQGEGEYELKGRTYTLKKGDGFLITPGTLTRYKADDENPWYYVWFAISGREASNLLEKAGLTEKCPVFRFEEIHIIKGLVAQMISLNILEPGKEEILLGLLYQVIGELIAANQSMQTVEERKMTDIYLEEAVMYIAQNHAFKLSVTELSDFLGINRSYLYTIFMEKWGCSPKDFIINYRMDKACMLLKESNLAIGDIARTVGYKDPLMFSKIFRRRLGQSPSQYRKEMGEES